MDFRKLLYAGLLAASVGCDEKKDLEKNRHYCENRLADAAELARETGSGEFTKYLDSRPWCKVEDKYLADGGALFIESSRAARAYCNKSREEAGNLIKEKENTLTLLTFQKNFRCDGQYYEDLLRQAQDLQQIIGSYQK